MRIIDAVKLVKALHEIKDQSLPIKTSHSIVMLLRDCEPHVHFYMEKETEIIRKYTDDVSPDGKFKVKQEDISKFMQEKNELDELEIEIDIPQIVLPAEITLTPNAMNTLEDYVKIEG